MPTRIRPAAREDLQAVASMAAALVRMHHAMDPARFFLVEPIEQGYARFLGGVVEDAESVLVVAEDDGELVGYAYGALEGRDWMALRDACGVLHDVFVKERVRRSGVARLLVSAVFDALIERGAPRLVLSTAAGNEAAQRLFASMGFRKTMIEMTKEKGG